MNEKAFLVLKDVTKSFGKTVVITGTLPTMTRDEAAAQYNLNHSDIRTLFGPDSGDADSHAGALAFGDAHLLLLPVRSFAGTVAALGDSAVVLAPSSLREAVLAHLRGAAALTTSEGN